jgi:hypothetical protein
LNTIAQQLNIKDFPFEIRDKQDNLLYFENSDEYWGKHEFDSAGRERYYENSYGFWHKYEYGSDGNVIYCEDSDGVIIDKRPKNDVITLNGIKYKRIDDFNHGIDAIKYCLTDKLWIKKLEFNSAGNRIYYEDSKGLIRDNRSKHDVITLNGIKYKRIDK